MKKLFIISLVLGMLIVFSDVVSAQPSWFQSPEFTTEVSYDRVAVKSGNTVLATDVLTFKGHIVMETATETWAGTPVLQIFLCGTLYKGASEVIPLMCLLSESNIASASTFTITDQKKAHPEVVQGGSIGTFYDQSESPLTGVCAVIFKCTVHDSATTSITGVGFSGSFWGGYVQGSTKTGEFESAPITTELTPLTLTDSNTSVTCVDGVVTQQ